jgi:branched-chain amino acid transport system substrate-binding protein
MIKKICAAGLLGFICIWMSGCKGKEKVYRLALAVPMTGDIASRGLGAQRSASIAVEEANQSGKFKYRIELTTFDDRADPKEAVNVANQIVSDPSIFAVVGHMTSGCSVPAAVVYARHQMIMASPSSTNTKLTLQQLEPAWKWPRSIFRITITDAFEAQFIAKVAREKFKLKTACIVHDKATFGQGIAEEFSKDFKNRGGRVFSFDGISVGDKDFKALLTRIKSHHPELIFFGGMHSEGGLLFKQARETGLEAALFSGGGLQTDEYIKIAGDAAENSYIAKPGLTIEKLPQAKSFIEKYQQKYPGVDMQPDDLFVYETAKILLDVLERAGGQAEPNEIDKAKMIELMRNVKYDGVLGHTAFDEKGDNTNPSVTIYVVQGGKFSALELE